MSTDLARRAAALLERANADPPTTWRPRDRGSGHPQAIAGVVVERGVKVGAGFNGDDISTVTIEEPAGSCWMVWCFGAVLQQDLASCRVGDVVAVKYEGHREGKSPSGYELFRVVIDRDGPATAEADSTGMGPLVCEHCGLAEPEHAQGCPSEIPF